MTADKPDASQDGRTPRSYNDLTNSEVIAVCKCKSHSAADEAQPADLDLDLRQQVLRINWQDGAISKLPLALLRKHCPCAGCRTEKEQQSRTLLPVLKSAPAEMIEASGGHLVGNYALQIDWSDGHNTGIYDFRYLRQLSDMTGE